MRETHTPCHTPRATTPRHGHRPAPLTKQAGQAQHGHVRGDDHRRLHRRRRAHGLGSRPRPPTILQVGVLPPQLRLRVRLARPPLLLLLLLLHVAGAAPPGCLVRTQLPLRPQPLALLVGRARVPARLRPGLPQHPVCPQPLALLLRRARVLPRRARRRPVYPLARGLEPLPLLLGGTRVPRLAPGRASWRGLARTRCSTRSPARRPGGRDVVDPGPLGGRAGRCGAGDVAWPRRGRRVGAGCPGPRPGLGLLLRPGLALDVPVHLCASGGGPRGVPGGWTSRWGAWMVEGG